MLCPLDGQFVTGIVVDDLRDVVKGWTMLAQDKLLVFCLQKLHMQEALTAPRLKEEEEDGQCTHYWPQYYHFIFHLMFDCMESTTK